MAAISTNPATFAEVTYLPDMTLGELGARVVDEARAGGAVIVYDTPDRIEAVAHAMRVGRDEVERRRARAKRQRAARRRNR